MWMNLLTGKRIRKMVCLLISVGILCIISPIRAGATDLETNHLTGQNQTGTVVNEPGTAQDSDDLDKLNIANTVTLTYDYHHSGIPIRFADRSCGAKVTLSGNAVSAVSFTARQYTAADETALLLPLRQAMAVAAQVPDRELLICYADYGTERVEPQWLSE